MRRRLLLASMTGATLSPTLLRAQTRTGPPTAGFVISAPKAFSERLVDIIMGGVRESNRSAVPAEAILRLPGDDAGKLSAMTAELLAMKVSVMLGNGPKHLRIAQAATRTVPIVAIDFEDDPVAAGYAASIAHPGGNVTGIFLDLPDFTAKWIEFLRECIPRLSSVALIWDPETGPTQLGALTKAAGALGLRMEVLEVRERGDYAGAIAAAKAHGTDAAILLSTPLIPSSVKDIAGISLSQKLPAITLFADFARAGGLLSYGPNFFSAMKQVGVLMGKILSGAAVANLPIERPATFELLVNLKTARSFGLTIPPLILARADEVIE